MAYDKNLQAFKDAALSQGYQQSEIDAFTEMAIEGQKNKKIREQETTRSELDLYRQKKIIDQDFKTDAASTPGSLTEMESRGITEGVAELKYDEASGSYKVIPKNKETGISVKDLSEQDTKMFNALTAAQAAVGILDEGLDTGPLGNIISGVESLTGKTTKYSDYKSKLALSTSALKSYLIGGAQTDPELRGLADALPKKTDQEAIAKQKLNNFINLYGKKFGLTSVVDTKNVAPGVGLNKPEDLIAKNNNEVQTPDDFVKKPRSGLSEWLYGDRESKIGKGLSAVGNILSPVSFTAGGIIKSGREMNEGTYKAPETGVKIPNIKGGSFDAGELILPQLVGAYRGLTQKQPLMTEAPAYIGVDPESLGGLVLGFAAELVNPDPGAELVGASNLIGKSGKLIKGLFGKKMSKVDDLAELLATDPRKFDSAVNKIAQNVVEPAEKMIIDSGKTVKQTRRAVDNWIIDSGFEVPAKRADKIRPRDVGAEMIAHGFGKVTDIDELKTIVGTITGDSGLTTKLTRDAIGSMSDEINVLKEIDGNLTNAVFDDVSRQLKTSYDIPERIRKDVGIEISNMMSEASGSIPDNYDINKLYDVQRALEKKYIASNAKSTYLSKNLQAEDIGMVYKVAADKIREIIEQGAKERGVIQRVITNDVIAKAYEISPRYAQKLVEAKAKDSLSALRSTAAPFAKLSEVISLTEAGAITAFKNLGRRMVGAEKLLGGVPFGKPVGATIDAFTNNKLGRGIAGGIEDVKDFSSQFISKTKEPVSKILQRAGILMARD